MFNKKLFKIESQETGEQVWVFLERELNDDEKKFLVKSINEKLGDDEFDDLDLEENVQRALDVLLKRYDILGYVLPRQPFSAITV